MRLSLYRQGQRGQRRQARAGIAFAEEVRLCTAKKRNEGSQVKHFLRAILPALILYHEIHLGILFLGTLLDLGLRSYSN